MKNLNYLIIHCTATPAGRAVSKKDIEQWHIKERGWSRVGYSDMIHLDGELENLIPFNQDDHVDSWEISNGVRGKNGMSRHVVYVGGLSHNRLPADTRTIEQYKAMATYVKYMVLRHPSIKVGGHTDFSRKNCPCFDVAAFCREIGIEEKNIYRAA